MFFTIHQDTAFIGIKGEDSYNFLQGIITNDIMLLGKKKIIYSAMLNARGRFFCDFFIYHGYNTEIILEICSTAKNVLLEKLNLFKLRSQVTIQDLSSKLQLITLYSENNLPIDYQNVTKHLQDDYLCFRDPRKHTLGIRIVKNIDNKEFCFTNSVQKTISTYQLMKIKNCIPSYGQELIPDKTIPLEANLEQLNAISNDKGCYLGQELTARTKHQGLVRKKLYTVYSDGLLNIGDTIWHNQEKIGILLSYIKPFGIAKLKGLQLHNQIILTNDKGIKVHFAQTNHC